MSEYLEVAVLAAKEAGAVLRDKLGKVAVREKHPADLVTEADEQAQRTIAAILRDHYPLHAFIGEEKTSPNQLREDQCGSGAPDDLPLTWIVDPLDGTTNFVHQFPFFAVSIGLARGNELLCGVIYNPMLEECYTAALGQGSFLNGQRIHVSDIRDPGKALITFSFAPGTELDSKEFAGFVKLVPHNQAMRRTGSTALNLACLGAGRFDAVYCSSAHPWDVAAGVAIVQEAGGVVFGSDGQPFDLACPGTLAAATGELGAKLSAVLQN
ncbi:MAG: inositol monophosphatase family protein [Thermoguttaceae bacterium]|nr:inositol monophosphatase family protein [Thermoguttaceae bacterium]